jgi:type IV pilus assembly protein PilM
MTTWNENENENEHDLENEHDGMLPETPSDNWEQGETHELSTREVSFRRRETGNPSDEVTAPVVSSDGPADEPEPPLEEPAAVPAVEQKVPFYKREISLGRKKERPVEAVAAVATVAPAPPVESTPAETVDMPVNGGSEHEAPAGVSSVRTRRNGASSGGGASVGVKISQGSISAAVVEQRDGVGELTALVRRPLDPGVVVDGEVANVPALAQALEAMWSEERLPRRGVRLGLFGSRVGVRPVDITGIDEDDRFANAVRFKAHEVLPIGVQESVLDYRVLSERVIESGELVRRTLLVVAPRDQVMPYVEAFRTARIGLDAVDIDALALMRAFVDPVQPGGVAQDSAAVVVSMDRDGSTLLVSGGGMCEFTRAFDWGGSLLSAAVAEQLEITPDQAWGLLETLARQGAAGRPIEDENERAAAEIVRARLVPFARELVSSLQFYQQQLGSLGIADIVLAGTLADVPGVAEALHQLIGVEVRIGDPAARLVLRTPIDAEQQSTVASMAIPIGLAVRDVPERAIDLIPPDERVKIRWRPRLAPIVLPAAAAIPLVVVGLAFFQAAGTVSDREAQLETIQADLDALPQPNASIDPALTGEAGQRASSVASLLGQRLAWNTTLSDVSRVLPADVWLTSFNAAIPDPAAVAAGSTGPTSVEIAGKAVTYGALSQALTRLAAVPSLSDVQLFSSTAEEIGLPSGKKVKVIGFQISANVDSEEGS